MNEHDMLVDGAYWSSTGRVSTIGSLGEGLATLDCIDLLLRTPDLGPFFAYLKPFGSRFRTKSQRK